MEKISGVIKFLEKSRRIWSDEEEGEVYVREKSVNREEEDLKSSRRTRVDFCSS